MQFFLKVSLTFVYRRKVCAFARKKSIFAAVT
jgi:hypothetical protein